MAYSKLKDEMEDICFGVLEEKTRDSISTRVAYLKEHLGLKYKKNSAQLYNIIAENGIEANNIGRIKRPYSIWRKMRKRHISFQHLADIFAYRIIVDTTEECYKVLVFCIQTIGLSMEDLKIILAHQSKMVINLYIQQ